jgi:hypothetical protein
MGRFSAKQTEDVHFAEFDEAGPDRHNRLTGAAMSTGATLAARSL